MYVHTEASKVDKVKLAPEDFRSRSQADVTFSPSVSDSVASENTEMKCKTIFYELLYAKKPAKILIKCNP